MTRKTEKLFKATLYKYIAKVHLEVLVDPAKLQSGGSVNVIRPGIASKGFVNLCMQLLTHRRSV